VSGSKDEAEARIGIAALDRPRGSWPREDFSPGEAVSLKSEPAGMQKFTSHVNSTRWSVEVTIPCIYSS
jgi:hypothetical protein